MKENFALLVNKQRAPITDEQLRAFMPAAYASEPAPGCSKRYGFFPTYRVIETMHDAGYVPVEARNYLRKSADALHHTRHSLRFRHVDKPLVAGDVTAEILMLNSHDRTSRYEMYAGLFRTLCANGLIVQSDESAFVRPLLVKHTKDMVSGIMENVQHLTHRYGRTFELIDTMRKLNLTQEEQRAYAGRTYLAARPEATLAIAPQLLLTPRRVEDEGDSLWHVVNRVQENLIRGGMAGTSPKGRRAYTTEIKSMKTDMEVNKAVWDMAMQTIRNASISSRAAMAKEPATV